MNTFLDNKQNFDPEKDAITLSKMKINEEIKKKEFLNSIEIFFRNILYKCNYILNNEKIISKNLYAGFFL